MGLLKLLICIIFRVLVIRDLFIRSLVNVGTAFAYVDLVDNLRVVDTL